MRDTLSNMVSCFLMSRQQAHMTTSNSQYSHIYICWKCSIFVLDILWIAVVPLCKHMYELESICYVPKGEIDTCSRDFCMQIDTFVDFISTWIYLSKNRLNIHCCLIHPTCSIIILHIYDIRKYYLKGSCFLTIIVLLSNNELSKYVLLSKRSTQYKNSMI